MRFVNWLLRSWLMVSSVGLTALQFPAISSPMPLGVVKGLMWTFALGGLLAGLVAASTEDPGRFAWHGLRRFVPRFDTLNEQAKLEVSRAKKSIKVIDSYWGGVDAYRHSVESALSRTGSCKLQILLAKKSGGVARLRDAAMEGTIAVDGAIDGTLRQVEALKRALSSAGPGLAERVTVRFFDALVPGPMIIVDDRHLFLGSFLQRPAGSPASPGFWFGPTLAGLRRSDAVPAYVETFDRLWSSSTE